MMADLEPLNTVVPSTSATSTPARASAIGVSSTAGCLRTVMTWCSCGRRYLLTEAGPALRGAISLIAGSDGVQEGSDRVACRLEPTEDIRHHMACRGRLGYQVKRQEENDRPSNNLLELHGQLPVAYTPLCYSV